MYLARIYNTFFFHRNFIIIIFLLSATRELTKKIGIQIILSAGFPLRWKQIVKRIYIHTRNIAEMNQIRSSAIRYTNQTYYNYNNNNNCAKTYKKNTK